MIKTEKDKVNNMGCKRMGNKERKKDRIKLSKDYQ